MGVRINRKPEATPAPTKVMEMVAAPEIDGEVPEVRIEPRSDPKPEARQATKPEERPHPVRVKRNYKTKYPEILEKLFKNHDTCVLHGSKDTVFLKAAELILQLEAKVDAYENRPPWEDVDAQIAANKKLLYGE